MSKFVEFSISICVLLCLTRLSITIEVCGTLGCLTVTEDEAQLLKKPAIMDGTGVPMNWTDPLDGWNLNVRLLHIANKRRLEYQRSKVPRLTELGYKISKIPQDILQVIKDEKIDEPHYDFCSEKDFKSISCQKVNYKDQLIDKNNVITYKFGSRNRVSKMVENYVRPELENWIQSKLAPSMLFYGIRRYTRGTKIFGHVDSLPDHLIAVILQVDQKVDQDWPLILLDHNDKHQEIILKPGQMLFYEGTTVPHGRPYPLDGDFFDNMFVGFTLENQEVKKIKEGVDEYVVNKALTYKDEF